MSIFASWSGISSRLIDGKKTAGQRSYTYSYDKSDRLESATFQANTGSGWTREVNTLNETMTYDHNGNIATLVRNKNTRGLSGSSVTSSASAIDNLAYTYTANTNSLSKVEDAATTEGFVNDVVNGTNEYTYTNDGSLNKDDNKGISSITYNMLGKPQVINFTSGKKVEYVYDAAGTKLTVKTWQGTTLEKCTNYSGGFVYEGSTPTLSFFSSPEGRVVKNGANYEYQYSITDHQGNTRVLFTSATQAPTAITATFEGDSGDNAGLFSNVVPGNVVTFVAANHTPGGSKVVRLNQNYKVGPSKSMKVYPGDKVDTEVWTYYENNSGFGTGSPTVAAMVTAIASAFGGVSGGGGESGNIFNGVNSALGGFGLGGNATDAAPAAYLNYILFDVNYKVLDMGWQRVPTSAYFSKQKVNLAQVNVKEAGYVFVYLSYEDLSNNYVQFDDFMVMHTKSKVIQGNEYYPFGLQTANSWTRENTLGNNFLNNGGTELNQTTQVYDLYFRNYDPVLGRFGQVDPMAGKYGGLSPYHFAGNSPAMYNDPMGDDYIDDTRAGLPAGPHDTGDPNRMYKGSDPYGTLRGRLLYADHLEKMSYIAAAQSQNGTTLAEYGRKYGQQGYLYESWKHWIVNGSYADSQFLGYKLKTASGEIIWSNEGEEDYYGDYYSPPIVISEPQMFTDVVEGLEFIWKASLNPTLENLALFTDLGLLVMPNTRNRSNNSAGSFGFMQLEFIDRKPYIRWDGGLLEIKAWIHTHPNSDGIGDGRHGDFYEDRGDWTWTKVGISSFVTSYGGVFEGTYDGRSHNSDYYGPRNSDTYIRLAQRFSPFTK